MNGFRKFMFSRFFKFVMAFFTGSAVNAQTDSLSILFIGNSYTHNNDMPFLFEKIAKSQGASIHVEMSAESNHTFEMHSKRKAMFETINSRKWDYVVLQGFSRELAHDTAKIESATVPFFTKILDSIYTNNSNSRVLLYQTWGYENGASHLAYANTFDKMTGAVANGYRYLGEKFNLPIVPVGNIWKEVRDQSKINLYQKDGQHPSIYGSYLVASSFYTAIFKTGLNDKAYKPSNGSRKKFNFVANTGFDYLLNHFEENRLYDESISVALSSSSDGDFFLEAHPAFEKQIDSVHWSFGDESERITKMLESVEYTYQSDGWYPLQARIFFMDKTSVNRSVVIPACKKSADRKSPGSFEKVLIMQRRREEAIESEKVD